MKIPVSISNHGDFSFPIISYQAITGNNNALPHVSGQQVIISYQAITGNNNLSVVKLIPVSIISYQAITGNNNIFDTNGSKI